MLGEEPLGSLYLGAGETASSSTLAPGFLSGSGLLYGPTLSGGSIVIPAPFLSGTGHLYSPLVSPRLFAARDGNWNGSPAYSDLYIINPSTGVPVSVGPVGFAIASMAFDPTDGTLYASTSSYSGVNPLSLIKIDPATGVGTLIGAHTLISGFQELDGLAFQSDGTLYAYGGVGGNTLYTVNKATGALTSLGALPFNFIWYGEAIVTDGDDNLYFIPADSDTDPIGKITFSPLERTQISAIQNGDEILTYSGDDLVDASFDPSGVLWVIDRYSDTVMTLTALGFLTIIGSEGSLDPGATDNVHDFAALAWLGGVPPSPWFAFPDFTEDFEVAPLSPVPYSYSSPTPPPISTDGAATGSYSFKVDAANDDQYVEYLLPTSALQGYGWPIDTQWVYMSFALYIPSATAGTKQAYLFSYGQDVLIYSNGDGTAKLRMQYNSDEFFSPNFSEDAWHSIQMQVIADNGTGEWAVQWWVDGVTNGMQVATSGVGASGGDIYVGDYNHFGDGTDLLYYFDEFTWSINAMPPAVDLSSSFFNGVGSGTDYDSSSGTPVSGHPADDSYTQLVNHPLVVPGNNWLDSASPGGSPIFHTYYYGVMQNDALATTVSLATPPSHGTLEYFNSDGSFKYVPDTDFVGTDTFTYNGNGGSATVSIRIFDANTPALNHPVFEGKPGQKLA